MRCFIKSIAIILFISLFTSNLVLAVSDSVDISLQVVAVYCGNGICEPGYGETYETCPLDCPAPVPPAPPGAVPVFDTTPPNIFNLFISEITLTSATISWETNEQALCQLFWGKTSEYKEEAISEGAFYWKHSTEIINLFPTTTYHFKISCKDTSKNESETTDQQFTTLFPPDITPPANVSNFTAIPGDSQITLTWENPPDLDFKAVKIMRSEKFYPSNPWEGTPVYNEKGVAFVDAGLINGKRYYYTAFAYDKTGNYASGAIVSAIPQAVPPIVPPPPVVPPPVVPPPPEIEKLTFEDFDFIQEGEKIPLKEEKIIEAKIDKLLINSIDYEKVPEVLKTIMVTLEKGDKFFSFLLRINKEKTVYEATLIPPQEPGNYPLTISVLDYKNQTLKQIKGELWVKGIPEVLPIAKAPWYKKPNFWKWLLFVLLLLLLIRELRRLWKEIRKRKIAKLYGQPDK